MIPTIKTERLILRAFDAADAPAVQKLAGAFEIADTTLNIPHPYEDGMAEEWIATHQQAFQKSTEITFAITLKESGELIGAIGIMNIGNGCGELGYWIGLPWWNRGYCTEAGREVIRFALGELQLNELHAYHLSRNPASGCILQKLGFTHEKNTPRPRVEMGKRRGY